MLSYIGCAGWSPSGRPASLFGTEGTHLERYSQRFRAVEINSSFYRPHQTKTYVRWADSTPDDFRFAVKVPRAITHILKLRDTAGSLDQFHSEVAGLGSKLGPLLVQLPPSLRFDLPVAIEFFNQVRDRFDTPVVCEPRHASWFISEAEGMLTDFKVARVAADPAPVPAAASTAGWPGLVYYRLHGSPRIYYSSYDADYLEQLATRLQLLAEQSIEAWCIFDNTAAGAAIENSLDLQHRLHAQHDNPRSPRKSDGQ